ncbi:MAG TPA: N-acetyltransferase [Fervidicoccus fontis]|uniref:N-acetyltransferase n=1 Tax=Fervidicoccus fontis TaxID=683846 RepID=A0A7C2URV8_9CREN|nr:MAG: GNAT family N-acetyltransferase [Fervidicoccus sp.]HEU97956.1 N-acetyltransferase [Fervidicoccus fontis]
MAALDDFEVKQEDSLFYIELPEGKKAILQFELLKELGVMRLIHTYTPRQFRGRGLAEKMVREAVKKAREEGIKIEPVCSYSIYYFISHPEDRDVLVEWFKSKSDAEMKALYDYYSALERG